MARERTLLGFVYVFCRPRAWCERASAFRWMGREVEGDTNKDNYTHINSSKCPHFGLVN